MQHSHKVQSLSRFRCSFGKNPKIAWHDQNNMKEFIWSIGKYKYWISVKAKICMKFDIWMLCWWPSVLRKKGILLLYRSPYDVANSFVVFHLFIWLWESKIEFIFVLDNSIICTKPKRRWSAPELNINLLFTSVVREEKTKTFWSQNICWKNNHNYVKRLKKQEYHNLSQHQPFHFYFFPNNTHEIGVKSLRIFFCLLLFW